MAAYVATLLAMLALDALWLGVLAPALYQKGIGHLMAAEPWWPAAVLFYVIYAWGLQVFVIAPGGALATWPLTRWRAAAFGLCAYATYDLSNLATLRDWPVWLSGLDIAWGCLLSVAAAAAGRAASERFSRDPSRDPSRRSSGDSSNDSSGS